MKKLLLIGALSLASISFNAQAFWGGNNFFGNNAGGSWPVWTPMYWMEEFTGNSNYNQHYGNANPWSAAPMNNMPMNANPWSTGFVNGNNGSTANFPPNGYSPYSARGQNMGFPVGYPQGYSPISGFQPMPLAPSRGPTAIRP